MSDAIKKIQRSIAEFQASPEGYGTSLRHDFARLIVERLEELQYRQSDLAKALGKTESFVSRLIHENANCTLETVGEVLHVLGIKPKLVSSATTHVIVVTKPEDNWTEFTDGEEKIETREFTSIWGEDDGDSFTVATYGASFQRRIADVTDRLDPADATERRDCHRRDLSSPSNPWTQGIFRGGKIRCWSRASKEAEGNAR